MGLRSTPVKGWPLNRETPSPLEEKGRRSYLVTLRARTGDRSRSGSGVTPASHPRRLRLPCHQRAIRPDTESKPDREAGPSRDLARTNQGVKILGPVTCRTRRDWELSLYGMSSSSRARHIPVRGAPLEHSGGDVSALGRPDGQARPQNRRPPEITQVHITRARAVRCLSRSQSPRRSTRPPRWCLRHRHARTDQCHR